MVFVHVSIIFRESNFYKHLAILCTDFGHETDRKCIMSVRLREGKFFKAAYINLFLL
jgi:hypothetical protein